MIDALQTSLAAKYNNIQALFQQGELQHTNTGASVPLAASIRACCWLCRTSTVRQWAAHRTLLSALILPMYAAGDSAQASLKGYVGEQGEAVVVSSELAASGAVGDAS